MCLDSTLKGRQEGGRKGGIEEKEGRNGRKEGRLVYNMTMRQEKRSITLQLTSRDEVIVFVTR